MHALQHICMVHVHASSHLYCSLTQGVCTYVYIHGLFCICWLQYNYTKIHHNSLETTAHISAAIIMCSLTYMEALTIIPIIGENVFNLKYACAHEKPWGIRDGLSPLQT